MDNLKKMIKCSMRMLTEADSYADKYRMAQDTYMKDLYLALSQAHLEAYNKVHTTLVAHLNKMKRDDPTTLAGDMYELIHEFETEQKDSIMSKLD